MRKQWRRVSSSKSPKVGAAKPLNPFSQGRLNQGIGARFEATIRFMGAREDLLIVSNGLRAKRYADKVVAEKSNIDFLLLGEASRGEVAFIDAKAFQGTRFGRSMINARQLLLCQEYQLRGFCAGFVVYLREADHVGFYSARLLLGGKARQGFGVSDGQRLGCLRDFSLREIWCPDARPSDAGLQSSTCG